MPDTAMQRPPDGPVRRQIPRSRFPRAGQGKTPGAQVDHLVNRELPRRTVMDVERLVRGDLRGVRQPRAPTGGRYDDQSYEEATAGVRAADLMERKIAHYDVIALPVVDARERLVGISTHDDAFDVMEAEATEDFQRLGTVTNLASSVATATVFMLYRARIAWLMLLVFGNIFSGAGIAHFEDTIAAHLALMFFLPILIASGGNAGSQSATLMVRALATGDIRISDWGKVLGRELMVAILLGLSMAAAIAVIGVFHGGRDIAIVIALSMVIIVIVGSMIGILLP